MGLTPARLKPTRTPQKTPCLTDWLAQIDRAPSIMVPCLAATHVDRDRDNSVQPGKLSWIELSNMKIGTTLLIIFDFS